MSTRSGKRIHGSFHESTTKPDDELTITSGRKTRNKRLKENIEETLTTTKKRTNYVSYPTSEEDINEKPGQNIPQGPKITLQEQNVNVSINIPEAHTEKSTKGSRRTKKSNENTEDALENGFVDEAPKTRKKSKKGKKKKPKTVPEPVTKKLNNRSGKLEVESVINKSDGSSDSFHSAAGSPLQEQSPESNNIPNEFFQKSSSRSLRRKSNSNIDLRDTRERHAKKTKIVNQVDVVKDDSLTSKDIEGCIKNDATFDKSNVEVAEMLNTTFEKKPAIKRKSSLKHASEKVKLPLIQLNSIEIELDYKSDLLEENNLSNEERNKPIKRSLRSSTVKGKEILDSTFDKGECGQPLNSTYDLDVNPLNSTYDKDTKLDITDDKVNSNTVLDKRSSVISSDNSTNLTLDKSNDGPLISITSDESNIENIVNTTPVLIESSMDESGEKSKFTTLETSNVMAKVSATPLKREGTFTKDGPDVMIMSPKPKLSSDKTPVKSMPFPSPGCTPFHFTKSSQKEKSVLNLTHSIEKVGRKSSLIEPTHRITKVMFCSPVNSPAVVMQQKRKVIKSNLKGSNKSFIFDEKEPAPAPRKRSFTDNDADDVRAKRSRTGDVQNSVAHRLTRQRTFSATVKSSEPSTPSKKQTAQKSSTASKGKLDPKLSRTKLPNFAALHQKRFDQMESLNECQERKARRAKQLLTPTGTVNVLDRSSPRSRGTSTTEPVKALRDPAKKNDTPTKAPRASTKLPRSTKLPTQAKLPVLPTLESLRPGFTRFGFKMHTEFNPFSIPSKVEPEAKESKPNGLMKRQLSKPSLKVSTSRRDEAKQMVMREKSFNSLSDVKRKQNRSIIKGVRTNRRFELQMQMRNVNA